jgi:hypothetical protein
MSDLAQERIRGQESCAGRLICLPREGRVVILKSRPGASRFIDLLRRKKTTFEQDEEALASVINQMAHTGVGTDACLRHGCLPLPVNFHSPVPDLTDLGQRGVWDRVSRLEGIDFRPDAQQELLEDLGRNFGRECKWPLTATSDPYQFFTENPSFSYGCAAALHGILRKFKPRRVIEVGSGNSSLAISGALMRNSKEGIEAEYIIIDPYPRDIIREGLPKLTKLFDERVEIMAPEVFHQLGEHDILFVDSGHVVRMGSDVNFLILDVLPCLAPGVIVHFHDVSLPYEYSKVYATNAGFRMFWTEAYLLQAFLSCNSKFEILLAMEYLMKVQKESFCSAFPFYDPKMHKAISGSFWIRRKKREE